MFQKAKAILWKYKSYIFLATITGLLFLSGFCESLWIVAVVLTAGVYATCNFGEIFCYTMYFNLFSNIGVFYISTLVCGFLVILIKYIIGLVKKNTKFYPLPFVLTSLFVMVFSVICYDFNYSGFEQGILVIFIMYSIYFAFVYRKQIDVTKCFRFLCLALVVSAVLGYGSLLFEGFAYDIFYFDGRYKRLKLFSYHQNQLALYCIFAIAHSVYMIVNKKVKWWKELPVIALFLAFGSLTLSKMFFVMFVGILGYMFLFLCVRYKSKSLKYILPMIAVLLAGGFLFKDLVVKVINRFVVYFPTGSFWSNITTGRTSIWMKYISESSSSVAKLLFGHGLFNAETIDIGSHNVLLFFAFRCGLVGLFMLGIIAWSYAKASDLKLSIRYRTILPLLTYVIISFVEMIFSDRFFMFLILAIIMLSSNQKSEVKTSKSENWEVNEKNP